MGIETEIFVVVPSLVVVEVKKRTIILDKVKVGSVSSLLENRSAIGNSVAEDLKFGRR